MSVKKEFLQAVVDTVIKIDPTLNEDDVKEIASSMIKENIKNPPVNMDNNVNGNNIEIGRAHV